MEILFITHKYPPSIGGMQKQSFELITGMAKHHKVHTIIYDNESSKISFFLSLRERVSAMLEKHPGIELIHLNDGLMAVFSLFLKKITDKPIVVTIHGLDITMPGAFYQKHIVPRFKVFDRFIAVSNATASEIAARGFDAAKIHTVANGVDASLQEIKPDPDIRKRLSEQLGIDLEHKKILVSVGRPVIRKGFSWFLSEVLPKLSDDVVYLMIGPRPGRMRKTRFLLNLLPQRAARQIALIWGITLDAPAIEDALERPELKNRAFYLGKLPFIHMMQTLKTADLFIMPNIKCEGDMEGFGLVALEAAMVGTPVLAADIEGITDAVQDGRNGWLVASGNADAWVKKISTLLEKPDTLHSFGQEGQHYTAETFSWQKMVAGYADVFEKTVVTARHK